MTHSNKKEQVMTRDKTEKLGHWLADQAMLASADYLKRQHVQVDELFLETLIPKLRQHTKAAVKQALADGRKAYEANMPGYISSTVATSMRLAGIAAAKEAIEAHHAH